MTTLLLTKIVLAMLAVTIQAKSNWNQETRDYILEIHNEKRMGEGGCLMNKMVYDMELERQSKQWAEGCVFKHESKEGRGENLAWDSNEKPEKELILGSSGRWFDEKKMYSYGQYSCGSSCHYTQMVWGSTSKVGCYSYRCPNLVNAYRNAWYLVCFYTPKGNWNGEKPYDKKPCKKMCREGQTEEKGLCVGEAKGGDQGGEDGGCDDDQGACATWAKNGQCKSNPNYMLKHCRKSCKVCSEAKGGNVNKGGDDKGGDDKGGDDKGKGGSGDQGGKEEGCKDDDGRCAVWAKDRQCKINPGYMLQSCKKSCKVCGEAKGGNINQGGDDKGGDDKGGDDKGGDDKGGSVNQVGEDGGCKDDDGRCAAWAEDRQCKINPGYMLHSCKKSCKVCGDKTSSKGGSDSQVGDDEDCVDSISRCSKWAKANECQTNPRWMGKHCRYSCKKCNRKNRCTDLNAKCDQRTKANECDSKPSYMSESCQKSCEMC